jgi:hypothetical protein
MPNRAEILKQQLIQSVGLPFSEILPTSTIETVLAEEQVQYRRAVFTPIVTIWAFLSQVLSQDKSLRKTVSRVASWLTQAGERVPSLDTGAYCKARQRLPERVLERLFHRTTSPIEAAVDPEHLWCGRPVKVWDGTGITMSDTAVNQAEYPQHANQRQGCGFPLMRWVVMFSLTTGAALQVRLSAFKTSEVTLARACYEQLAPGDVGLADSAYGTYVDLALVKAQGADGVFRKHHARKVDFRRGQKLGIGDHIVTWQKPERCPKALSKDVFEALSETLQVREVHLQVQRRGFRPKEVILVTTLLDAQRYSKAQLAELYYNRWQAAEINLRHLKTTLQMDFMAAKSPEMVRKSIWAHLLAYNLLRHLMGTAARTQTLSAWRLSLQGTRQAFQEFIPGLAHATATERPRYYAELLRLIAHEVLPDRPYRLEPRVIKQRPKNYPRMRQPRQVLKAKLAA